MKQTKAAGTARERQVVRLYQDQGYVAFRTPASMGVCDVIAFRADDAHGNGSAPVSEVLMVEVKANTGSPFMNFRKADRQALAITAEVAGATALLCHWPPHGIFSLIPVSAWPD